MKNRVVVITGGNGGLGKAVVQRFWDTGAKIIAPVTSQKSAAELTAFLGSDERLQTIEADLTDSASVKSLFSQIDEEYGRCDVLVHLVGGFWMGGDINETPFSQFEKMIRLNLFTAFLCARSAFGMMKDARSGKIFTVAARAALELPAGMAAYTTSKAALLAFTESLAKEGAPYGVQSNTILPGVIDTPANRKSMPEANFDNWVTPEQIAEVILAMAQPGITEVTGSSVKVYGKS